MDGQKINSCTAFNGNRRIASGTLSKVAGEVKEILDRNDQASILIFDDDTSELVEMDFRGTGEEVAKRVAALTSGKEATDASTITDQRSRPGPGRPKLGVVPREVTLLPRHWDWLNSQPGGASVALRKLVEEARRANGDKDRIRRSQEATYRFMSAMAGDMPGFEEASRALFARNSERFNDWIDSWPVDVRDHTRKISGPVFSSGDPSPNEPEEQKALRK